MADREPAYTVVVVTYNSADVVAGLLDSVPAAVDHEPVEIVVVDNASTDDTVAVVAARDDCTLLQCPNDGYAAGINRGYAEAHGSGPLLVLNPDVRLTPGCVTRMREALAAPGVGIVAPRTFEFDGSLQLTLRREPSLPRALGLTFTKLPLLSESCNRPADYETGHDVDWAIGAVMLIRRECFDALGGWDASYFLFSEEVDFCLRARDAGWRTWYEPTAVVHHIGKHSGWDATLHTIEVVNRVRLYRRRHDVVRSWLFWLLALAGEAWNGIRGDAKRRTAALALLRPSRRPPQLRSEHRLVPR